ncbi:MAG: VWA domain-containing protein [Myxococcales bacterium]|nr:VWA domain-containing protein [Myxococcales bacterium]
MARSVVLVALLLVGCGAGSDKDGGSTNLSPDGSLPLGDAGGDPGFDAADPDAVYSPDGACASRSFSGRKLPLAISIVFDQSSSMSSGGRMDIAKTGLKKALSDTKFDDVAVGLFRFGYIDGLSGCTSDSKPTFEPAVLSSARTGLFAAIDKLEPSGATPTFSALNDAYAWLAPKILAKGSPFDGKVAVVLVTDGAPTCGSHTPTEFFDLVAKGRKATIDTFIIGLPGSGEPFYKDTGGGPPTDNPDTTAVLSKMAAQGTDLANLPAGCAVDPKLTAKVTNPCYYDLAKSGFTADALATALDGIRKATTSCEYAMPAANPLYDSSNPAVVVVDGAGTPKTLPRCTGGPVPADGCWDWADAGKTRVKIVGAACTTVKADEKSRVDILLQCKVK